MNARKRAELSRGVSGGDAYYEFAVRGFEGELRGSNILDLGCGTGDFGRFLAARFEVRPRGVDVIRHDGFADADYAGFQIADLDAFDALPGDCDFVFALGVIEYLTDPRRFIRAAAAALRPGGRLILTAPNPASLRSISALLRSGEFSAFQESSNPASITPVLAVDAARMLREAALNQVAISFSGRGALPGARGWTWQRVLPLARGRWFSDDVRIVGTRA